jgi:2'-5' RNA ligase
MRINIALLPPPSVAEHLITVAGKIIGEPCIFRIGVSFAPHMTLYMFNTDDEAVVTERSQELAVMIAGQQAIACRANGISLTANGYTEISYEKTAQLVAVQQVVISHLQAYRSRAGRPEDHLSEGETSNLSKHGYEFVGDEFRPHITLARFGPSAAITFPELKRTTFSFNAWMLGIMMADAAGAATNLLAGHVLS